jgi:uncharacterized protein with PQ loop repeat
MIGWIGSICLACCGVPQAVKCIKLGGCRDTSLLFLLLWLIGEVLYIVAVIQEFGYVLWQLSNYAVNIICVSVILYYRIKK